jgi:hypothetical protein
MRSSLVIVGTAIFLLILTYAGSLLGGWQWQQNYIMITVFLVLLTIVSHQINLNSVNQQGRAVIIPYLISTVLKLVLSGGFLMVIVKKYPQMVQGLVISFLVYYATFSTLEIILVNRRTKGKKF